jgi:TolA-binding protein
MAKSASDEAGEISPYTLFLCGDKYYVRGYQKKQDGLLAEAEQDFLKAIDTWQNMIQQLPASTSVGHAYYHSANCYREMGDYEHAIEQYVKLLEDYPNYYLAWDVHFKIGHYYQKLKDAGAVESSAADAHTKSFYKQMLEKYPDCHAAKAAQNWLKKHAK